MMIQGYICAKMQITVEGYNTKSSETGEEVTNAYKNRYF